MHLSESFVPILTKALELCCLLRRQKPSWSLTFPQVAEEKRGKHTRPIAFSGETMSDISSYTSEFGARAVDILIAPGLFKTGNTDGQLYSKGESVVGEAEVWCSAT